MTISMIIHEFKMMLRSKKNVLFIIALISLIVAYCFLILPNMETADSFDIEEKEAEMENLEAMRQGMIDRGGTGFNRMTGTPYAQNTYEFQVKSRLVHAFKDQNFHRFIQLKMKENDYDTRIASLDWNLIADAPYPSLDMERNIELTKLRYQGYLDADVSITYEMIEQKTALQTSVKFILDTTAAILLFCAIYFSSDMITRNKEHRSVLQGVPVGWYRLINVKSFVAFLYTLVILLGLFLLAMLLIAIQNGFGSFKLPVPITLPSSQPDDYMGYRFSEFDNMTIAKFLLLSLGIIPVLIYLFIRLNAIFSLLFKNPWIVIMVSTVLLFVERIYYSRTTTELFGIDLSYFPQTYFDFGRVISGEKYYLIHLESITYQQGIIVLLSSIVVLEIILFVISRAINKRKFYRKAA
ncbi:ABC transporter permease subunit [Oceanobacillus sojae]|uniref:ABC transporter permease subunit n=1 Tax=Oceanobacillus sojae TaxID=582851 RepID=UPI0036453391